MAQEFKKIKQTGKETVYVLESDGATVAGAIATMPMGMGVQRRAKVKEKYQPKKRRSSKSSDGIDLDISSPAVTDVLRASSKFGLKNDFSNIVAYFAEAEDLIKELRRRLSQEEIVNKQQTDELHKLLDMLTQQEERFRKLTGEIASQGGQPTPANISSAQKAKKIEKQADQELGSIQRSQNDIERIAESDEGEQPDPDMEKVASRYGSEVVARKLRAFEKAVRRAKEEGLTGGDLIKRVGELALRRPKNEGWGTGGYDTAMSSRIQPGAGRGMELNELDEPIGSMFIKFRFKELPDGERTIVGYGGFANTPKELKAKDALVKPFPAEEESDVIRKIKSLLADEDFVGVKKIYLDIPRSILGYMPNVVDMAARGERIAMYEPTDLDAEPDSDRPGKLKKAKRPQSQMGGGRTAAPLSGFVTVRALGDEGQRLVRALVDQGKISRDTSIKGSTIRLRSDDYRMMLKVIGNDRFQNYFTKQSEVAEGLAPGQAAWKKEMMAKGAVKFWRDQHGGGAVDRIVAYDKDGKVVGGFNRKGVAEGWIKNTAAGLALGAATLGGAHAATAVDDTSWNSGNYASHIKYDHTIQKQTGSPSAHQKRISDVTGPNTDGEYRVTVSQNGKIVGQYVTKNPPKDWMVKEQGVAEGSETNLSIEQLATISDEALDAAYHYGRSSPGNTFGWQANLKSAEYASTMINSGVTDIEKISDAIHRGWNMTARAFVQNPDQFSDTEKLRASGKLEAKLQQREQLMKQDYAQLPEDEKEKDRVVARALLKAITGSQEDVGEDPYMESLTRRLSEKLRPSQPVGDWIGDFEQAAKTPNMSGHHQFKGKSKAKIQQMAIKAHYAAQQPKKNRRRK